MNQLWWILAILAALRTFHLMTVDELTFRVRNWVDRWPEFYRVAYYCNWCALYWYGALWVTTGYFWHHTWWWQIAAGSFAVNYVTATWQRLMVDPKSFEGENNENSE